MNVQTYPALYRQPMVQADGYWLTPSAFIYWAAQKAGLGLWGLEPIRPRQPDPNG